jgi:CO/xanthine dehydrogenase Mo-binding subunit
VERVRVIHPLIGGSFGRKEDIGLQILAALGSFQTRRPVMLVNSREESIQYHTKRHAITLRYRTGVNSEGKVLVQEITIWGDTGAYACLGPAAISNCAQSAIGPYEVPNVLVEGFCVYTNNPPASAMRGFGGPQAAFGYESQMNLVATTLSLDPLDVRKQNALRRGSLFVTGVEFKHEPGIQATIDQAAKVAGPQPPRMASKDSSLRRGRGVASVLR